MTELPAEAPRQRVKTREPNGDPYIVAYLHSGDVAHSFHHSMRGLIAYDANISHRVRGFIAQECGSGRITDGRNDAVTRFLVNPDINWLAFVDSDMGFDPDTFERLIDAAKQTGAKVAGALAFGQRRLGLGQASSVSLEQFPTIYQWVENDEVVGCATIHDYPEDTIVRCDATGAACFVVHREVLENMAAQWPKPRSWFDDMILKETVFGEDITFFWRVRQLGYPLIVHTGVKTSHRKVAYLTENTRIPPARVPNFVVIPMKNNANMTVDLVRQLHEQNEYAGVFVIDNGSDKEELETLVKAINDLRDDRIKIGHNPESNIHVLWNAGMMAAEAKASGAFNIAVLNNDLRIGDFFLSTLGTALRRDPLLAAVSPNYDKRNHAAPIQYVTDICGNRYDGSGGLAGFAFMLKGEAGYRFPEELRWWFGDNHLVASILLAGSRAGIVLDATCEHIDGGSQSADWSAPEWAEILERDRATFHGWVQSVRDARAARREAVSADASD